MHQAFLPFSQPVFRSPSLNLRGLSYFTICTDSCCPFFGPFKPKSNIGLLALMPNNARVSRNSCLPRFAQNFISPEKRMGRLVAAISLACTRTPQPKTRQIFQSCEGGELQWAEDGFSILLWPSIFITNLYFVNCVKLFVNPDSFFFQKQSTWVSFSP